MWLRAIVDRTRDMQTLTDELADGGTQRMTYSAKLGNLIGQINAAVTVAQVRAVVW